MGWPAHNPELWDELITARLPNDVREKVESGEIELHEVNEEIFRETSKHVDGDYADRIYGAAEMREEK